MNGVPFGKRLESMANGVSQMDYQLTDVFLTIDEACRLIGGSQPISRATFYRQVQAGRFPAPVHPCPGISRVRRSDLIAAIAAATQRG